MTDRRAIAAWLAVPWRDRALLFALMAAAATPAFLIASADLWRSAAADEIARRVMVDAPATDDEVVVETPAWLRPDEVMAADDAARTVFDEADSLGPARRTVVLPPSPRDVLETDEGASIRVPLRLVHHEGADTDLDLTANVTTDGGIGIWISTWLAAEFGLAAGDRLTSRECVDVPADRCVRTVPADGFTVLGVTDPLWREPGDQGPVATVDGLDAALVPQFIAPFGLPNFAIVFVDEPTMADLGVQASMVWRAEREEAIDGLRSLESATAEIRTIERRFVQTPSVAGPVAELAAGAGAVDVRSTLPTSLATTRSLIADLDQPFAAARLAGVALGLAACAAGGVFVVARSRREFRLLAGEGDRWPEFAGRAVAQSVAPAIVGTVLGVVLALVVAEAELGVGRFDALDLRPILVVAVVAVAGNALATGIAGERSLGDRPPLASAELLAAGLLVMAATTALLWFQVGRGNRDGGVDLAVVLLPIAGLATAVAIVMFGIGAGLRRTTGFARRLGPMRLLLWRRLDGGGVGERTVVAFTAVAIGVTLLAGALVETLDRTLTRDLATELGGATRVELIGPLPEGVVLPERTTVIGLSSTRVSPGNRAATVIMVDPGTVADAVVWPDDIGIDLDVALDLLASDAGDDLPALALVDQTLPVTGGFGLRDVVRYETVGRLRSAPLASAGEPSLLVAADRLDAFVADERARVGAAASLRPPSREARQRLVSALGAAEVQAFLDDLDVRYRNVVTDDARRADADIVGPRFAFGYLRWLGIVAVLIATVALAFQLSARRAVRSLTTVLTVRMGASPNRLALVTAAEIVVLLVISSVVALLAAQPLAARLLPRFDPTPDLPPRPELVWSFGPLAVRIAIVLVAVGATVWASERWASDRQAVEVLRDTPT